MQEQSKENWGGARARRGVGMYKKRQSVATRFAKGMGRYAGGKTQKMQFQDVNLLWALWVASTFSLSGLPSEAMLVFGFPV